ncbi:MAG: hypothetical protein WCX70_00610 [Candidatus Paceibacterota bacterium]|jgi:hypothetical protein
MAVSKSKRDILKRSKEREKKILKIKIILGFLLILFLVGSFIILLNWHFLRFDSVVVVGNTAENKDLIQTIAQKSIAGRYLGLVPKGSIFFLHKKILVETLKQEFPRLAEIVISLPDLNTLKLVVNDKKAKLVWCDGQDSIKKEDCYYLNENGEIYSQAPVFSKAIITEIIGPLSLSPIGRVVMSSSTVEKIQALTLAINHLVAGLPNSNSSKLIYWQPLTDGDWSGWVMSEKDKRWQVIFNEKSSLPELLGSLSSTLKNKIFLTDWTRQNGRLEYIDIRFDQKIFYRFIN